MAITTLDALIAAYPGQLKPYYKSIAATTSGTWSSLWTDPGQPGAGATPATGAGAAPTDATAGAIPFDNPGSPNISYLSKFSGWVAQQGIFVLYDRLVHTSGLSGTSTSAQTVNSTALSRWTDGVGVECWIEVYTVLGTTAATATVSYTNQAGTAGRTGTGSIPISMAAKRMIPIALQSGDSGVRSVETVTLSVSTGSVGDFGVTLLRRLESLSVQATNIGSHGDLFTVAMPQIADDACLTTMFLGTATSSSVQTQASISILQG